MWELAQVRVSDVSRVEEYLKEGYEPFDTSADLNGFITIWLKRKVEGNALQRQARTKELPKKVLPKKRRKNKNS